MFVENKTVLDDLLVSIKNGNSEQCSLFQKYVFRSEKVLLKNDQDTIFSVLSGTFT